MISNNVLSRKIIPNRKKWYRKLPRKSYKSAKEKYALHIRRIDYKCKTETDYYFSKDLAKPEYVNPIINKENNFNKDRGEKINENNTITNQKLEKILNKYNICNPNEKKVLECLIKNQKCTRAYLKSMTNIKSQTLGGNNGVLQRLINKGTIVLKKDAIKGTIIKLKS
jgi:hypothetical protein